MGAVMDTGNLVQLFFGFQGRINRAKYWIAVVVYLAVAIVLVLVGMGMAMAGSFLVILIAVIIYIPMIISGVAVGIKRLHDRGKSGWWLLLFYLAPAILSGGGEAMGAGMVLSLASLAISIWALVELGFLKGDTGANAYGPDPVAI